MNIAYFDNAATTFKKPQEMHDFMYNFYNANSVNVGRGDHQLLNCSNNLVRETRDLLLKLFNANSLFETIFTPTATEAINVILQGQKWNPDMTVYISPYEHNAVYRTIIHLQKVYGFKIEILAVNDKKELDFESIKYQFIQNKPNFVVTSHVSNAFGIIIDINRLGEIVKKYNSLYLIDCAQSAGLLETDIRKCQADYMVFAGHKTLYGPFGCSGFICKKSVAPSAFIYGGTGVDSANEDMPNELPTRFEAGSINIMAISGLNAALKWINKIGIEKIRAKEQINYKRLYEIISSYDNIKIVGKCDNNTTIVSCIFDEFSPDNVGNILSQNNVIVRTGLHCAPLAHKTMGTYPAGTVRFSISYFTDEEDFNMLINVLDYLSEV